MATITLTLSAKTDKETLQHEIMLEFWHGRKIHQRAKSNIFIQPEYWNEDGQSITIPQWRLMTDERKRLIEELTEKSNKLNELTNHIQTSFQDTDKNNVEKDWLKNIVNDFNFPKEEEQSQEEEPKESFFDVYQNYIDTHKFSDHRRRQNRVIWRTLKRFELYKYKKNPFTFDNITADVLREFETFLAEEHTLTEDKKYMKILKDVSESRPPKARGKNTINDMLTRLRSFFIWAVDNDHTTNNPFRKYDITQCVYGTPYYISIEERNQLYNFDFSDRPDLSRQRDIFVFQCLIGCRVSDLWEMTKSNIVDGAIEYIPRKTKEGRAITVRVPLTSTANEILERHKTDDNIKLFKLTSQQQYNRDIKELFRLSGLNRIVTIINPTTREEEQRPICEIASSHMARRSFVGNLYKKVKDPNLIGKLSGHKEGSRAFSRYRDIDEDTRRETVDLLES